MKATLLLLALCLATLASGAPRTWTSSDGKSMQAELLEAGEKEVKLKRATDFQIVKVPVERLSAEDQKIVRGIVHEQNRDAGIKSGAYAAKITGQFEKNTSKQGLNYQIFGNPKWDGKKRYPIVIFLHGSGSSGGDNEAQMGGATKVFTSESNQAARPCFMIAPQCPDASIGWNKEVANNLMALLGDLVDKLPIDERRIYLTGSSMGGFGTFNLASKYPNVFACAVPLCGGGDPKAAEALKPVPMWIFHGDKDDMVPVERSRTIFKAIQDAGGTLVKYSELAGEGHGITGVVYAKTELHAWMFEQRLSAEARP
ncbi:MAG: prolyl oligopeptidase family serine peptidase [Verrucomicrobiaceae bacterium]|nr:prolyl oligopeptidase family serine peptidase [Verrucomicrobiaceae bacterium]